MSQDRVASATLIAEDQNLRLLVIGDDDAQAQLYKSHLAELSHQITVVASLEQATAIFNLSAYDCIVADLSLPDAWPAECSRWYSGLAQQRVPIVVVGSSPHDAYYARQHHPDLPYVFSRDHLDPHSLSLFVSAAVRKRTMLDREQGQECLQLGPPYEARAQID